MITWTPAPEAPDHWLLGYRDGELVASICHDTISERLLLRNPNGQVIGGEPSGAWERAMARFDRVTLPEPSPFQWAEVGAFEHACNHDDAGYVGGIKRVAGSWVATTESNDVLGTYEWERVARYAVQLYALKELIPRETREHQEATMQIEWSKTMTGWVGKRGGETVGWVVEHDDHFEAQTPAGGGTVLGQHGNAMKAKAAVKAACEQETNEMASKKTKKKNGTNTDEPPRDDAKATIDGSTNADEDKSVIVRPTTRQLRCELGRDDILEKADRASHLLADRDRRQDEIDNAKKQAKADIERLEAEHRQLNVQIRDRAEYRSVDCDETRNYHTWTVTVTRKDTGEVVDERAMSLDERRTAQTELDLGRSDDSGDATDPEAAAAGFENQAEEDAEEAEPAAPPKRGRRGRKAAQAAAQQ